MNGPYTNPHPTSTPLHVSLPDGTIITSSHTANLNLPGLPPGASICHLFPELTTGSLLSIGLLCDHNCTAIFTKHAVIIKNHEGATIIQGVRDATTNLWTIPINQPSPITLQVNSLQPTKPTFGFPTQHDNTIAKRVAFYHAALFSPTISTWLKAIDAGYLTTWPALTAAQVRKYYPFSPATVQGHLDQTPANYRSTTKHKTKKHAK
jgi:hypothetical protein